MFIMITYSQINKHGFRSRENSKMITISTNTN